MSDSSGVANTNSWTVLTPEETVAETLRPVEGMMHHEDTVIHSATEELAEGRPCEDAFSAQLSPVKSQQASWGKEPEKGEGNADLSPDSSPTIDDPQSSLLDVSSLSGPHPETHSQSSGFPKNQAPPSPDPDSFSDSYTHISSSPDLEEPPASQLTTEPQEEVGVVQEEEGHKQDVHCDKGPGQGVEESDLEVRRLTDSRLDAEAVREVERVSGVRRRRGSLLVAVERIGREEEEEEDEQDAVRLPQPREVENMGFSLNKCILGAVVLLGLGTIFFSGVFMDLDDEGDHDARELRATEGLGKQDWLNPEAPPPPVDAGSTDYLNKLAKEDPQIAILQAQLLAQKEELKVAQMYAEEGGKERNKREEIEKEHSRLKKEMASLPVLQKENEKMKKELESVAVLQKEVETLRSTVAELSNITVKEETPPPVSGSVSPPSEQARDDSRSKASTTKERETKKLGAAEKKENAWKTEKTEQGKEWNKDKKMEWTEGGKKDWKVENEWKKGKYNQEKEGKERKVKERKNEWKKLDKNGEWKEDQFGRSGEAKPGKVTEFETTEKKHWGVGHDWEKGKPKRKSNGKKWEGKEERKGMDERWIKGKGEGKVEEQKNLKKEVWNKKKEWKNKGNKNLKNEEWNKRKEEWNGKVEKNLKNEGRNKRSQEWKEKEVNLKNGQWNKEEKEWKKGKDDKEWKKKEWKGEKDWKNRQRNTAWSTGDGKKGTLNEKYEKGHRHPSQEGQKERWRREKGPFQTHRHPSLEQPDYWSHQRERLWHQLNPATHCNSVDACAHAEELQPVTMPEFQELLLDFLAKAEEHGVESASTEELAKLITEFFRDGVFIHDQLSFRDFVEDVDDILEDMVEGENNEEIQEAMDGFEEEALSKFAMPGGGEKVKVKSSRGQA